MRLIIIGVLLGAVPAVAQPVMPTPPTGEPPAPCQVTLRLARVPTEVQAVVDTWVHTEPSCATALDVSMEPIDGGYLVNARDARGTLRVRFVPDAQTAGVLIASWSADDRVAPADLDAAVRPPAIAARAVALPPDRTPGRRALLAAVGGFGDAEQGGRGEIDLLGHRAPVGLALTALTDSSHTSVAVLAYVGVNFSLGPWQLRPQLALGTDPRLFSAAVGFSDKSGGYVERIRDYDPVTEVSLAVSRPLGAGWAVSAGAMVRTVLYWHQNGGTLFTLEPKIPVAVAGLSYAL
jgi:hypothetical protein